MPKPHPNLCLKSWNLKLASLTLSFLSSINVRNLDLCGWIVYPGHTFGQHDDILVTMLCVVTLPVDAQRPIRIAT
jgi:hypothetical protein